VRDGDALDAQELEKLLGSESGLVLLRGKWVEVDRETLAEALKQWQKVEREVRDSVSRSSKGCACLPASNWARYGAVEQVEAAREWAGISAGSDLEQLICEFREPDRAGNRAAVAYEGGSGSREHSQPAGGSSLAHRELGSGA
jgi:hypothetical protein